MLTVACVLKSGGCFGWNHVEALHEALLRHLPRDFEWQFYTLSDVSPSPDAASTVKLIHDWPGWWSKIELFRLPGPLLYFDLDTVIVGDLSEIARGVMAMPDGQLMYLPDFYRQRVQSGILGWSGDMSRVYETFKRIEAKGQWMRYRDHYRLRAKKSVWRGDGEFLHWMNRMHGLNCKSIDRFTLKPAVFSYKRHVRAQSEADREYVPDCAAVVCFHGLPRPWEVHPRPAWVPDYGASPRWDEPGADPVNDMAQTMGITRERMAGMLGVDDEELEGEATD